MSESLFEAVTFLIRLVYIPALAFASVKSVYDLDIHLKASGVPALTAVAGLTLFNVQFLIKRKKMFNYGGNASASEK